MYYDDFDTKIQPEELHEPDEFLDDQFETCNRHDAPDEVDDSYMLGGGCPYDEGSDRDNWEDQQVFLDQEC